MSSKNSHSRTKHFLISMLVCAALIVISCHAPVARSHSLKIILPLYIYPNWYEPENYAWSDVVAAAQKVPITAIINPNNGPDGQAPNQDYLKGLADLKQDNISTLGYVYTLYGDRPIAEVKQDIDLYYAHFGVKGIFLDESASGVDKIDYYQDIYRYIKIKDSKSQVVINPGTHTDREYLTRPAADTSVIFENYTDAWGDYQPQAYVSQSDREQLAILIHSASDVKTMKSHLDKALERNIGYVYITDDSPDGSDGNPWDRLPTYWQEEVDYIKSLP